MENERTFIWSSTVKRQLTSENWQKGKKKTNLENYMNFHYLQIINSDENVWKLFIEFCLFVFFKDSFLINTPKWIIYFHCFLFGKMFVMEIGNEKQIFVEIPKLHLRN